MTVRWRGAGGIAAAVLTAAVVVVAGAGEAAASGRTSLELRIVSSDGGGVVGNGRSDLATPSVSADGRFVAFVSAADNLVANDTNGQADAFVKDRLTGVVERVSVTSAGVESNDATTSVSISADGRSVAFLSAATNLVPGDTNGVRDVFVRNRTAKFTRRVSVTITGAQANGANDNPAISSDGMFVAFQSAAGNLVPNDLNQRVDVFGKDLTTGALERVSLGSAGVEGDDASDLPAVGGNGRYVAFASAATNLVAGDTNAVRDVFVRDRKTATTIRASLNSAATEGNQTSGAPAISADGRSVAFSSAATNLVVADTNVAVDVFVRDLAAGTTRRASVDSNGNEGHRTNASTQPAISADGRFVAFTSLAFTNYWGTSVYVRDLVAGTTEQLNVRSDGGVADHESNRPAVSADGRSVAFNSFASNLAPTNGMFRQTYVKGPAAGPDANCDFAESAIVCELDYPGAVGPVSIRWYVGSSQPYPGTDDQEDVTFACTPGDTLDISVEVSDRNGPMRVRVPALTCLSDTA